MTKKSHQATSTNDLFADFADLVTVTSVNECPLTELRKLAEIGDPEAQYVLSQLFMSDDCWDDALNWGRKACENHYQPAYFETACLLKNHFEDCQKHRLEIYRWLRMAAEGEHEDAMIYLGTLCIEGFMGEERRQEGLAWISRAALSNHPEALYQMGLMTLNGVDNLVHANRRQALSYFSAAANRGHEEALKYVNEH